MKFIFDYEYKLIVYLKNYSYICISCFVEIFKLKKEF